jgi:hypothetical protein
LAREDGVETYAADVVDEFAKRRMSRREALGTAGKVGAVVVGLAVVGAGAYFAGTAAAPPAATVTQTVKETVSAPATTVTQTVTETVTGAPTTVETVVTTEVVETTVTTETVVAAPEWPPWEPEPTRPDVPLKWVHWGYRPDIITENIEIFMEQNNENLTQEQLAGDYQSLVETKFLAGEPFDMVYGNVYMSFRWVKLGWCKTPEELEPVRKIIKPDMIPSVAEAYSDENGVLAGLTYFLGARGCIAVNDVIMERAGMAGELPETFDELYDWCRMLGEKQPEGMKAPLVPAWFNAFWGSVWQLTGEVGNISNDPELTKTMWDREYKALWSATPGDPVYETLKVWREMVEKDLIEKAVITAASDAPGEESFLTGQYALWECPTYGYWHAADPTKSQIPDRVFLTPATKQPWGLIDTGLYTWPTKNTDDRRSARLLMWFGYKDNNGEYLTAKKWAIEEFLHTAYAAVLEDPAVKSSWRTRLGDRTDAVVQAVDSIFRGMTRPWVYRSPLYGEWMVKAPDLYAKALVGDISVEDAVDETRKISDEAWEKYHG